jgi:hypothetical protein
MAVFLMMAAASSLRADEGKIPLYQPTTIAAPGHYILTRDVAASAAGGSVFDIQADGVTLNLNGFSVLCQPPDPCIAIGGGGGVSKGVTITGGTIVGGMYGIHALNETIRHLSLSDLKLIGATDAAVKVDNAGLIEARGIIVVGGKVGIDAISAAGAVVSGISPCVRVTRSAIRADTGVRCTNMMCQIEDNSIASCRTAVALVDAVASAVTGNALSIPGEDVCFSQPPEPVAYMIGATNSTGLMITDNHLRGDLVSNGNHHGIYFDATSDNATIARNTVSRFGDNGIHVLSSNSWIDHNLVNDNMGHGLYVDGANNFVENNKVAANAMNGFFVNTSGHAYRGNVLRGNTMTAVGGPGAGAGGLTDGGGNIQ